MDGSLWWNTITMRVSIATIQRAVADEFAVPMELLCGESRFHLYVIPRHVAMWLARTINRDSFPQIGAWFGCDHSSVMNGCRRTRDRMTDYPEFGARVHALNSRLAPSLPARQRVLENIGSPASQKALVMRWHERVEITPAEVEMLIRDYELEAA